MKMDRNRMMVIGVIALVIIFIISYTVMLMGDPDGTEALLDQPEVPELEDGPPEYASKTEAVNSVREERGFHVPSVYDESMLDSTGTFDPLLQEKERQRIVDSIYRNGRIDYGSGVATGTGPGSSGTGHGGTGPRENSGASLSDFSKSHGAFFDVAEQSKTESFDVKSGDSDAFIMVEVNGEQTVRDDERLELRLAVDALINGQTVPRNSLIYGFVSFRANRVLIRITNIDNRAVDLKAFDLMDGNEGIYIKNSVRAEATGEVLDDIIQDINIPGVPQIGGIKQVFRRNNRNVKATIYNQYQLILKPSL